LQQNNKENTVGEINDALKTPERGYSKNSQLGLDQQIPNF